MGLTVPFELRLLLAAKPEALSAMGRIFVQEIQRWQRQQARALGYEGAEAAAVSFTALSACQRVGVDALGTLRAVSPLDGGRVTESG